MRLGLLSKQLSFENKWFLIIPNYIYHKISYVNITKEKTELKILDVTDIVNETYEHCIQHIDIDSWSLCKLNVSS